ncbi:DUF5801 repeats-in-toxin domain-containing protein, partial [Kiloniella sp. b19]|uniref:DUF5801 repeats-in-toxin domain-containing protein n=1 Tax=Kiloniella sp. GXU_MW_B19 TaxID=3141326 RepID=UPI0031CFD9C0
IALASEAALETAAGAAAGPQGGGGSSYNDDLGSVIGLLDAQDGLDGTDGGPLDGVGFETVVPDPAEGVFTLSFLSAATVVPVVDSLEGAGISGTFAGGFEDALPNQNLDLDGDQSSEGDDGTDDNPFVEGSQEAVAAPMQLIFTFAPADNETLDTVTLAGIEGFDGSGDAGTTRLFVGGFGPEFEVTALPVIITPENFGSVFVLPAQDSDNDIDVSGSAQISDPDSGATASLLFAETAVVDAVADVPVLTDEFAPSRDEEPVELQRSVSAGDSDEPVLLSSGENATVQEESLVRVPVNAQLRDVDGSEVLTIAVSGVPSEFTLNNSSLPTGWEIQSTVAGEDGTTTYTLAFNTESGEGDATGLSGYLEFNTNDFTTQGVAAEDDNEGGSEDSIPDDQDVLRVASTEPDADAGRNNDGSVNDGAPVTITVTATAEEVNLDGGELTTDNNVSSASLDFTFEIAEDIPEITAGDDGFTLTHDETADVQPGTNDQDSSAQIGVIGTAAITFNYSFKTDAALDEADGSDGAGAATDGEGPTDGLENLAFDLDLSSINGLAAVDGTADGSAITLSVNEAGDVLEGRDEGGALVFTVSLQRDAAEEANNEGTNEGGLVFTQYKAIRHTDTDADNETENFSVTLRITDDEGDTSTQSFTINVNDDAPTIDNPVDFAASDRDDAVVIDREPNGLTRPSRPPQEISRSTFFLNEEKNEAELSLRGSLARGNGTNINEDGYELQLKQGETLSLDASGAGNTNGLVIRVFTRSGGSYVQELQSVDGQLTYTAPSDDAYFIQVFNPNAGQYNLDVTISNPAGIAVLDEDGLTGGNAGAESGIDGDVAGEAVVATGSLGIDFGTDGPASSVIAPDGAISFAGLNGATAGFTVGGEAVTYAWDAGSLTLKALDSEGGEVFVLTVTSVVPSQYSIELKQSIDHPEAGAEDNVTLDLPFVATDGDGDTIEGSLKVAINDDSPENSDAQPISVLVREDGLGGGDLSDGNGRQDGSEFARIRVSDLETQVSVGADAPVTFAFNADLAGQAVVDGDGNPVTSNGAAVVYEVVRDGAGEVVGINGVADGRTVFEVTRRPNGDFRFDLDDQIDHPDDAANNDSQTLGLDLSSVFTATDSDGDTIVLDSAVTVNVEDDIPVTFGNLPVLLDDDNLSGGNPGGRGDNPFAPFHTSGVLSHSIGADEVATVTLEGVQLPSGFSYELNEDKTEIEIRDGDVTVLTITLTDQQTGAYTVEQNAPVDHPAGRNENNLDFVVRYRVTDADNDYANGAILINVDDDTPVVSDEDRTGRRDWIKEKNLVGQESLSISGDLEFSPGADGGEITSVAFAGYEDTEDSDPSGSTITSGDKTVVFTQTVVDGDIVLSGTVDGGSTPVLTVTVDQATGAYSVELFKAIDHPDLSLEDDANDRDPLTLNFDYTVTDGDGDTATATLSVVVEDEEADAHDVFAGTLNEADLSDGNTANDQLSGVLDVDANPDGIRVVGLRFEGWEDGEDGRLEGEVLRSGDQNVVFGDVTTNGDGDLVLV